jgi:hypothetical protein
MYITGISKKKSCAKQNAVLEHSRAPKPYNFLNLKRNYLNTSRKHGTMVTPYLTTTVMSTLDSAIAEHCKKQIQSQQRMDEQIHKTKEYFVMKNITVPEAT